MILYVPRHAQYLHNAWKRHQDAVYWVDIDSCDSKKGLKFYQTRSNAIILQVTLPAYCIPKVVRLKTGEVLYEKVCMSPRLPPKISLKHEWTRELGQKVDREPEGEGARQPEGEGCSTSKNFSNQPNQIQIQFVTERCDLLTCKMEETRPVLKRSMLISFNEVVRSSDRTERPVVSEDMMSLNVEQTHDRTVRPVAISHTAAVQDDSQVYHEANTLNVDNEVLRKRMNKIHCCS